MANSSLRLFSIYLVLIFALSATSLCAARLHIPLVPTSARAQRLSKVSQVAWSNYGQAAGNMHRTDNAHVTTTEVMVGEQAIAAGVIRSSPAHPMPTYKEGAAPTPLPEFPTLGPPIVWSFPATPLPALEAPPPKDLPALPRTGSKHGGVPPSACEGGEHHHHRQPTLPPSVPFVAAEPAVSPGPLEAPEGAPEPTAGGPISPPYH